MYKKIKKRVSIFLGMLIIFLIYVYLKSKLSDLEFPFLTMVLTIISIVVAIVIFLENRHPSKTIVWLMILSINPLIGLLFYSLFGTQYKKQDNFKFKPKVDFNTINTIKKHDYDNLNFNIELLDLKNNYINLYNLLTNITDTVLTNQSQSKVLTNGKETYESIISEIRKAKQHIHMEYYIINSDKIGNRIKDELIQKAKEGVKVKILYDYVGSIKLSKKYIRELRESGIETKSFEKVKFPKFNNKINFRNHRKIIIIDGKVGFVGGINIGDEYLGENKSFGFWRDTHLIIKGENVWDLQKIFLEDWFYATKRKINDYPLCEPFENITENGLTQIISSGPDQQWQTIKQIMFTMINSAKKSIWITSPYFIPDEDILSALKTAALSNIDVKLLMPSFPDKKIVFYASRSFYEELIEAGVEIYTYQKGFVHSKIIIVDDELATIGTSNMDTRSFNLNFEVNALLYKTDSVNELIVDYKNDLTESKLIKLEEFKNRSNKEKIYESFSRLSSPLL